MEVAAHAGQITKMLQDVVNGELLPGSISAGESGQAREWWMIESSGEALCVHLRPETERSEEALHRDPDDTFLRT